MGIKKEIEKVVNYEYRKHTNFAEAVAKCRAIVNRGYNIKTDKRVWDGIVEAYLLALDKQLDKQKEEIAKKVLLILKEK